MSDAFLKAPGVLVGGLRSLWAGGMGAGGRVPWNGDGPVCAVEPKELPVVRAGGLNAVKLDLLVGVQSIASGSSFS